VVVVDAADTSALNDMITRVRELDEVINTKTRLILDERLG
jgi:nitrate reductase NapAB chaperone NapD